jgi:hypothetical protein
MIPVFALSQTRSETDSPTRTSRFGSRQRMSAADSEHECYAEVSKLLVALFGVTRCTITLLTGSRPVLPSLRATMVRNVVSCECTALLMTCAMLRTFMNLSDDMQSVSVIQMAIVQVWLRFHSSSRLFPLSSAETQCAPLRFCDTTPCTLHPAPYTLHPAPYTLHTTP